MPRHTAREKWAEPIPYFDGMCEVFLGDKERRCYCEAVATKDGFAVCARHARSEGQAVQYVQKAGEFRFGPLPKIQLPTWDW